MATAIYHFGRSDSLQAILLAAGQIFTVYLLLLTFTHVYPRKLTFFGHENPMKRHVVCINFISFTAHINNALHYAMESKG